MQETTGDLKLHKIELHDSPPDITVINPNWDKIDTEITGMKSQKADKTYVDQKVSDLVGSAPEALDTLKELSTALGNDPNFATTVATQIGQKVDKVSGKGLSTNDYTTAEKNKLAGVATNANNYVHPTTAGNKHIPSGGKADDVLMWSADGTAVWGEAGGAMLQENNTLRLVNPKGASLDTKGDSTGVIKIKLPQSWTSTMMKMRIEVFNYKTNESFTVLCGGYNYSTDKMWYVPFAQIISSKYSVDLPIRFGHDGTKCCITIGEVNSSWSYLKVAVTEFFAGHHSATSSSWKNGWSISLETALPTTVNHTLTNNLPASDFNKLKNKTNATQSANGLMSSADKVKLDGIATGANKYIHPTNHPPSIITQDANNRFVTDAEKTVWNTGIDKALNQGKANWKPNNWKKESDAPSSYGTFCETIFYSTVNGDNSSTWNNMSYCIVRTVRETGNVCRQEVFGVYGSGGTAVRYDKGNDSWSDWGVLYTTRNKPSASDIGALQVGATILTTGQDLNELKTLGVYGSIITNVCTSLLNKPSDMIAGELRLEVVSMGHDAHIMQVLTAKNALRVARYYRVCSNSLWGEWIKIYDSSNKPTKADVGLSNVDNTSDANKPISTATQNALNLKADKTHVSDMTAHITASERTAWNGKQPKEDTTFMINGQYVAVRTPKRTSSQYYEFWDGDNVGWADIKAGELYAKGNKVYHTGNKPTASDVGALPITGGTVTGDVNTNGSFNSNGGNVKIKTVSSWGAWARGLRALKSDGTELGKIDFYGANPNTVDEIIIGYNSSQRLVVTKTALSFNGNKVYHEGNKPTPANIGAEPAFTKNSAFNKNFGGNGSATTVSRSDHTHSYLPLTGGTITGTLKAQRIEVKNSSPTTGLGISLYEGSQTTGAPAYGIMFSGTPTYGTHGAVTGDWATYLTMTGATNRGWIFKHESNNVASISSDGTLSCATLSCTKAILNNITSNNAIGIFNTDRNAQKIYMGGLLVSNNYEDSTKIPVNGVFSKGEIKSDEKISSGNCSMKYNSTTESLDFIFV